MYETVILGLLEKFREWTLIFVYPPKFLSVHLEVPGFETYT